MAIRNDILVFWQLDPRVILVEAPSQSVAIQDLHDTLRHLESLPEGVTEPEIVYTEGKVPVTPTSYVGLTLTLLNAVLKFEDRAGDWVVCDVYGGNLRAVDEDGTEIFPISTSSYVMANRELSVSPTISDASLSVPELTTLSNAVQWYFDQYVVQRGKFPWS